ncbi:hypothetical protein EV664_108115 [Stakelama pacifica]|uniref:Uncharacterized protein n=1 Tax=Stakelama pacifica TaxID=517720 RepID=A0A4R6FIH7_9SPHN|nr:hypothetical protein EV664_108115 [Stakelama pacifica]
MTEIAIWTGAEQSVPVFFCLAGGVCRSCELLRFHAEKRPGRPVQGL